jgi:hypothetical protein
MVYAWNEPSNHVYATGEIVTANTLNTYVQQNIGYLGQIRTAILRQGGGGTATSGSNFLTIVQISIPVQTNAIRLRIWATCSLILNTSSDQYDFGYSTENYAWSPGAKRVRQVAPGASYIWPAHVSGTIDTSGGIYIFMLACRVAGTGTATPLTGGDSTLNVLEVEIAPS